MFRLEKEMLDIVKWPDQQLKKHSVVVPDINGDITSLVSEMFDAMDRGKGVGLAGVQVGKLFRLFITRVPNDSPGSSSIPTSWKHPSRWSPSRKAASASPESTPK